MMKTQILKSILLLIALYTLQSFDIITEWVKGGPKRDSYTMEVDSISTKTIHAVRTIKSLENVSSGFGTYTTEISASRYAGKHIRITGFVKTSHSDLTGGLWLLTDGSMLNEPAKSNFLCDENNQLGNKASNWRKQEIEFDIPSDATTIQYGALLKGNGQIWFRDIKLEVVDKTKKMH